MAGKLGVGPQALDGMEATEQPGAASRTESQALAELTGKCKLAARAALNASSDDFEHAFRLLMSNAVIVASDELACEVVPLQTGMPAQLGSDARCIVQSVGDFSGFSMLRVSPACQSDVRLLALDCVEVCRLAENSKSMAPGWCLRSGVKLPELKDFKCQSPVMQACVFDPGLISLPVSGSMLLLVRQAQHKRPAAAPKNTRASRRPEIVPAATKRSCASYPSSIKKYRQLEVIGAGAFGTVHLAEDEQGKQVAMKLVAAESQVNSREVELLRQMKHPCIITLLDMFERRSSNGTVVQHIVMEYVPRNLHQVIGGRPLQVCDSRCFLFQLLRALLHLTCLKVCHRDLKPENLLVGGRSLKVADFGSAKRLSTGPSSSYICSRWWRAPELVVGASDYSGSIDYWSAGCIAAEMMLGRPLFMGDSNWGQMYEITRVLGTPDEHQIQALHPKGSARITKHLCKLAELKRPGRPWPEVLPAYAMHPEALELPSMLLVYDPGARALPAKALGSQFFMPLSEDVGLPEGIFNYTAEELSVDGAKSALFDLPVRPGQAVTESSAFIATQGSSGDNEALVEQPRVKRPLSAVADGQPAAKRPRHCPASMTRTEAAGGDGDDLSDIP